MSRPSFILKVRRPLGIRVVALVSVSAAMLVAPAAGQAATFDTVYDVFAADSSPFQFPQARFPERLTQSRDITGDGVPDVIGSAYDTPVEGQAKAGAAALYSGADRTIVYTLSAPDPQAGAAFGFYVNVPGDLNGDGKDDLLVGENSRDVYVGKDAQGNTNTNACGAPEPNGCNEDQGRAYAFDGASGRRLLTLNDPNPQPDGGFGGRIAGAGDVTGDGVPDITVGAPANDVPTGCFFQSPVAADCRRNEGEAFIFNGRTGALVRQLNIPATDRAVAATCTPDPSPFRCGNMGGTVQSPGDVNRDGVADQIVAAYSLKPTPDRFGRVYLFSGMTGDVLARIDAPAPDASCNPPAPCPGPANAFWGLQDIENNSPGDVTGDGVPDIYENGFLQDGANGEYDAGRSWIFDGAATVLAGSGVVAREIKDPNPAASKAWGFTARKTDYNKDGFPDLIVGLLSGTNTVVQIMDGRDGSTVLKTLRLPAADLQPGDTTTFSQGIAAPGDLNNDGEPDYAVTAQNLDVGSNVNQGRLYFYVSNVPPGTPPPGTPPPGTPPPGTPPVITPPAAAPILSGLSLSPFRFRAARSGPSIATVVGTTVRYTLSKAASVGFRVQRAAGGRRVNGRCVKPTRRNATRKRCTRYVTMSGSFTHRGKAGSNRFKFRGRLAGRALRPKLYRLRAVATDSAGRHSAPRRVGFRIVRF